MVVENLISAILTNWWQGILIDPLAIEGDYLFLFDKETTIVLYCDDVKH